MIFISANGGLQDETPVLHIFVIVTNVTHVSNASPLTQVIYWHKYLRDQNINTSLTCFSIK